MNTKAKVILLLANMVASTNVSSTGVEFLAFCDDYSIPKATYGQGYCMGVVVGVAYMSDKICSPDNVSNKQMVLIVEKYVKENPQYLHYSEQLLAETALSETWPCQK